MFSVPDDKNENGFEAGEAVNGEQKLKVSVKLTGDWYIVKIW